jgi:dCMP deaminase
VTATRLDWDTSWLLVAAVVAKRSRCVRYRTGTVIVDRRNRVVATGYIGPAADLIYAADSTCEGFCHRGRNGPSEVTRLSYSDCTSIHSELNALLVCDRRDREGGTIYVTSVPCWTCAKAIANSGVARAVVVDTRYEHAYRSPEASLAYLRDCGLTVDVVEPPAVLLVEEGELEVGRD